MSRPPVTVVMPFAGSGLAATRALGVLSSLATEPGDERILVDNSGLGLTAPPGVEIVEALRESSPAHARNAGAARARSEWILFLDADCLAPPDLLERYFLTPVTAEIGALAGEIVPAPPSGNPSLAERYGAARSFLGQAAHLAHPYLPRAAAANLLVRRAAFEQIGGFYEGLRAAEDTDFSWRLQRAGWGLELCPPAHVEHRYRASVSHLRRQWRGYAAGRAWLGRRYAGFTPEPAVVRALRRVRGVTARAPATDRVLATDRAPATDRVLTTDRVLATDRAPATDRVLTTDRAPAAAVRPSSPRPVGAVAPASHLERARFLALDALLAGEELAGFLLSNRPAAVQGNAAANVFVAERVDDQLLAFALTLDRPRVEAERRSERVLELAGLRIDYREDDGTATKIAALVSLWLRAPRLCLADRHTAAASPTLVALAPAVARLRADKGARVYAATGLEETAARLTALSGEPGQLP